MRTLTALFLIFLVSTSSPKACCFCCDSSDDKSDEEYYIVDGGKKAVQKVQTSAPHSPLSDASATSYGTVSVQSVSQHTDEVIDVLEGKISSKDHYVEVSLVDTSPKGVPPSNSLWHSIQHWWKS